MSNRALVIIFIGLLILGIGGFAISQFQSQTGDISASPSPSPSDLELNFGQNNQSTQKPNQPTMQIKQYQKAPTPLSETDLTNKKAVIQTPKGTIEFEIFPDSPKAASNFIFLTNEQFYNGLTFHRVEDWVIQGGDPTGTGSGGPGYRFEDEKVTREYKRGIVAMANAGPNTNGSQFFILTKDTPLPKSYTIFGQVIKGLEVIDMIEKGDQMQTVRIENLK